MSIFTRCDFKNVVNVTAEDHLTERQAHKNVMVCLHLSYSWDLVFTDFWIFFKVKMTMKCKDFKLSHVDFIHQDNR